MTSKDHYIQEYLERQKAYVNSYTSKGLELPPSTKSSTGTTQHIKDAKKMSFGFDTPILLPRVIKPILTIDQDVPPIATPRVRKTQKALQAETLGNAKSDLKRPSHGPPLKQKRKEAEIPFDSDEEREARLSERRERKRVKRSTVKPDTNIHNSPSSERKNKKVPHKKEKKHFGITGLALLHGLSATNVGKNRLTLKPLASLGVFKKGKSSTKTRVRNAKKSGEALFSESAFLGATRRQCETPVDASLERDSSSQLPSPATKKISITNYHKNKNSTRSTSSDGFGSHLDQHMAGSLILDPRTASWHDQELSSKGLVVHPASTLTPAKHMSDDFPPEQKLFLAPASAIATIYDTDGNSSIHPSHSASQVGLERLGHTKSHVEVLTSKYFAVPANHDVKRVSPTLDQIQQGECHDTVQHNPSSAMSNSNPRDAYALSVSLPHHPSIVHHGAVWNVMDGSSPLRVHGIPQEPLADKFVPHYGSLSVSWPSCSNEDVVSARYPPHECPKGFFEGDMEPDYHDFEDHDREFLEPLDVVYSPSFYSAVQEYSRGEPHDGSVDVMAMPHEVWEGAEENIEHAQEMGDYEHSNVTSRSYHGSFSTLSCSYATGEAYDDGSCSLHPFLQGRAMLLGIVPYVRPDSEQTNSGNGLLSAEVDVAKHLKDHWRPHRL